MPFTVRAAKMVERGEAKTFAEACRMLRQPRSAPVARTKPDPTKQLYFE